MFDVNFFVFNIFEGTFWLALSVVTGLVVMRGVPFRYRFLGAHTAFVLLVFGVSDFIENYVGGFWYTNEWLFVLKSVCVIGLLVSIFWYTHLRSQHSF